MAWRQFLFSPQGRINRARYWGAVAIQYGVGISVWLPAAVAEDNFGEAYPVLTGVYFVVAISITLACIVSHLFAEVKRFHDRDKPWPWIFIGFIPYIGGIWLLVELGILEGTRGRNRYGPDPLSPQDDIVNVFGPPETVPVQL